MAVAFTARPIRVAFCSGFISTTRLFQNRFGEKKMASVYVEARPKGRPEGTGIGDCVVEDHADHVPGTLSTEIDH
ncbi:MAG TPA: hypothetical protein VGH23_15965 [Rhizomicrobium sp.]|jgi:hypothetical protein